MSEVTGLCSCFSPPQSFDAALAALENGQSVDLSKLPPPLSGGESDPCSSQGHSQDHLKLYQYQSFRFVLEDQKSQVIKGSVM